jgi:hypothetical protein
MSYDFRVILFFDERKNQAQRKYPVAKREVRTGLVEIPILQEWRR